MDSIKEKKKERKKEEGRKEGNSYFSFGRERAGSEYRGGVIAF
jgi:hypothetical protein